MTHPKLTALGADPARAAILLDFDGTLAPIVSRPEEVAPVPGAREVLAALATRFRLVAVVSGRPTSDLERLIGLDGVRYEGLYGLPGGLTAPDVLRTRAEDVAKAVPEAWVEPKGATVAVHYRQAVDPVSARAALAPALVALAEDTGHELFEGKMVFELAPAGESRKGGAVDRLVRGDGLEAALYAGDDLPDLEAFAALDQLAADGLIAVKVAVGGPATPEALRKDADVVVDDPASLVTLLRELGGIDASR